VAEELTLHTIRTPCLVLDEAKMSANIERMKNALASHPVSFRPHLKTAKCIEIARRLISGAEGPAAVSTLAEAEYFANHGVRDILYAVGVSPEKLGRVVALLQSGINLTVVVDNVDCARAVAAYSRRSGIKIPAMIEIDCDGRRAGVSAHDHGLIGQIGCVLTQQGAQLKGVMTHAGASYGSKSVEEIRNWARTEREVAVSAAHTVREAGLPCESVSIGSTPTALHESNLSGVTELRAGVFVFFDLVMAGIGVCHTSEIALSVLATIIDIRRSTGRIIVDAGWMALSRDRGTATQKTDCGYGLVCDLRGYPVDDLLMTEASQEHGVLALRPDSAHSIGAFQVGDRVRILPNHACATAAQHEEYIVVGGASPQVHARWARMRGW